MLKEIIQFTEAALADPVFRNFGLAPREGLHIVLQVKNDLEQTKISESPIFSGLYSKKVKELDSWFKCCAAWAQVSWMVDTNKCFDPTVKAIHSTSPFCFALKRTNLDGGEQFLSNQTMGKSQVYERIDLYFSKAAGLLEDKEHKAISEAFRQALNDRDRIQKWLDATEQYELVKDGEYVIFYLSLPLELYAAANQKYLKEKLFNTGDYNTVDEFDHELLHGTSNWLNGFPAKKPFLKHQSASFDIAGRISSKEAQLLYDFADLNRRKVFPNPLPLFIMEDERERAFKIFKMDAISGHDNRMGYFELVKELRKSHSGELGNYYLLFMPYGEIRDFDFVSKFEYYLLPNGTPWKFKDLFNTGHEMHLENVTDLMTQVLPPMFNNALVVRRKEKDWIYHWFDEMDPSYTKTHNAYLMAIKYRKAFYDYIYKSQRHSVTWRAILEILLIGILDDIRLDKQEGKYNSERLNILTKLNLLFNLHPYFSTIPNPSFMPDNIIELRQRVNAVAQGEAHLDNDEQFAFAAGQVIDRIFFASKTSDKSFGYLEPFLAQTSATRFKLAIANFFKRYKHANFSERFQAVSAEVLAYQKADSIRELLPFFLAGVFSENLLFSGRPSETANTETHQSGN